MIALRLCSLLLGGTITATLAGGSARSHRQLLPMNLGFEAHDGANRPTGWFAAGAGYEVVVDSASPLAGRYSLRSRWVGAVARGEQAFGVASLAYPVSLARGRALRLTGFIRTEGIASGYAGLWMRIDGVGGAIAFDNMAQRGVQGTTSWTKYEIELPVDSGASAIVLGALHPGVGTAWYDSLTIEVVGPPRPRTVADAAPFRPAPRVPEDSTRLLTDAELALRSDTVAVPAENGAWSAWVASHAQPIRSLGATDFRDLAFLAPLLEGKRIVQLGESGHGVAEFSLAKVRFIKYLHEQLGYDVIAFESSVFECDRAQRAIGTLSADQLMRSCIFGVWHSAETRPLFEYIKQTQSTSHPLSLAGFDSQISTPTASARPAFFRDLIATVDTAYARSVYARDSSYLVALRGGPGSPTLARDRDATVAFYDSLATWLRANERRLVAKVPDDRFAPMIARQTALSMIAFTRQMAQGPSLGTPVRDRAMADNLDFLLTERYPARKVMVWAHNFHIQHRERVATRDDGLANATPTTMGVWTARRHRAELYSIGLFMYRGGAAMNDGQVYPIGRMRAGSLESILHRAPWRYAFVDLSRPTESPETSWIFQRIPSMSWGTQVDPLVPRDEYDGILFIDTVHPPTYIRAAMPR
jgi:erythromycin esterase